jgi:hypothetical protein
LVGMASTAVRWPDAGRTRVPLGVARAVRLDAADEGDGVIAPGSSSSALTRVSAEEEISEPPGVLAARYLDEYRRSDALFRLWLGEDGASPCRRTCTAVSCTAVSAPPTAPPSGFVVIPCPDEEDVDVKLCPMPTWWSREVRKDAMTSSLTSSWPSAASCSRTASTVMPARWPLIDGYERRARGRVRIHTLRPREITKGARCVTVHFCNIV